MQQAHHQGGLAHNGTRIAALVALMLALVVMCSSLSSVFNYSARSYFPATSKYSLVQNFPASTKNFKFKVYTDVVVYYSFLVGSVATP